MRISIKKHNQAYLESLALQMGITDISEVLNYLLLDIKGLNYQFGNKPQPQSRQAPIGYTFDTSTFEPSIQPLHEHNHTNNQADETILRLASLIENF
jgi:hypothetical protein